MSGHSSGCFRDAICPRQEVIDLAVGMTVDDPGEDVGQVGERIDVVQLTGFDQGCDGGPMFGAAVRTCEQRIFPVECDGADRPFDGIVVEFDAAVVGEARQAIPA